MGSAGGAGAAAAAGDAGRRAGGDAGRPVVVDWPSRPLPRATSTDSCSARRSTAPRSALVAVKPRACTSVGVLRPCALRLDGCRVDGAPLRARASTSCTSARSRRRERSMPPPPGSIHLVRPRHHHVELLPVNGFNGVWNWVYDGVLCTRCTRLRRPAAYQALRRRGPRRGLAVIQVCRLQPTSVPPETTSRVRPVTSATPRATRGALVDLDDPPFVRFIVENTLMWLRD